ncbi:MAG TPA: DUF4286 family protein [Gemmatimonadales bacterium]|jgi:hypothetical protein
MLRYEVTLDAGPGLAEKLEGWMRRTHIPEMGATGCFLRIRFDRASETRFRTTYHAATAADLNRYLAEHAPEMRGRFQQRFPTGVTVTRETWEELGTWE